MDTIYISDVEPTDFIAAVDISMYPEIEKSNPIFYDLNGQEADFLSILKSNGVNTIRLKLWVDPTESHASFKTVKSFSSLLKSKGFKTWLTVHYSDTWADPGHQKTPSLWQNLDFSNLKDSVYSYTEKVIKELNPNFIQIGNEINSGFLHPKGNISNQPEQFIELLKEGVNAVRKNSKTTKIIIHYAGHSGSSWFFNQIATVDYDIIGLSYYPIWHGKSLESLQNTLQSLSQTHEKEIVIAETAYPFTLGWNDWTNNIVGADDHLILPKFQATPEGQKAFLSELKTIVKNTEKGVGFSYWGAELISWKGSESQTASPWENQALFDFENKALPVLKVFSE